MAIVYQKDAGLVQGLNQGFGALSQALGQRIQQQQLQTQFSNINKKIQGKSLSPTLLQEILEQPGGMQYLQQFGPIIAPILKEQARSQGSNQFLSSAFNEIFGNPELDLSEQGSPIEQANVMQSSKNNRPSPVSAIAEQRSSQTNVPSISGVPSRPPVQDSNRIGPQEQTVYQQGGQSGMGLNPPSENGDAIAQELGKISRAQPERTPTNARPNQGLDLSKLTSEQAEKLALKLAGSPYKEHQEIAKVLNDQAKTRRSEESEIRKEDRSEIAKYSEPYRDLTSIDSSVKKLEKAKDLIQNRKVSLDQNQFRRLATAILEDEDYSAVAQYFKSDEQKMLFALLKDYFKTKDIGGSNPSTKEVLLSLSTLPSENLGQEANIALINELLKDAKSRQFKGNKINELRSGGKKYNFGEFQKMVEDDVRQNLEPIERDYQKDIVKAQYSKQIGGKKPKSGYVWAVNSDGSLGQIPKQNVKKFQDAGGVIFNGN